MIAHFFFFSDVTTFSRSSSAPWKRLSSSLAFYWVDCGTFSSLFTHVLVPHASCMPLPLLSFSNSSSFQKSFAYVFTAAIQGILKTISAPQIDISSSSSICFLHSLQVLWSLYWASFLFLLCLSRHFLRAPAISSASPVLLFFSLLNAAYFSMFVMFTFSFLSIKNFISYCLCSGFSLQNFLFFSLSATACF